ncbi:hypothetical protein [Epilithonimonas arachidiradicis]|uniref:Uncharacterized protein n=1 Tax=Epilithonimonas arachidiradicis TaxID=1617282 RepID=A0A420D995_9FLAO|nr:hypothetical protein [Epilithonimonas arachidiradicis]RKE87597.1 hypothetical protein BXY58_1715 [Epilithonimonas arachidiradicis]GGG56444.1 hypothetical protein GCM10007332_17650 [Epilithonimonas arachidiradicis]
MDNENIVERLTKYEYDDNIVYTGFRSIGEARKFAEERNGRLVEVGFLDGNDNPVEDSSQHLIDDNKYYKAFAGPDYKILHSADEGFQDIAEKLKERKNEITEKSPDEKYFSDSDPLLEEDAVIILFKGEVQQVTSRERSKYLMHTKVYELAVSVPKSKD